GCGGDVRMQLTGERAKRLLDLAFLRVARDAEELVVVPFGLCHPSNVDTRPYDPEVPTVTSGDLVAGIRRLGLPGRAVCMHSSLRSLGHVVGGAYAVVDAFLAESCTLLVPSFSFRFLVLPPEG